jgi:hypothetical protein
MADKDKKLSVGETVALLAIAAVLTAALYAIVTGVWKWATANQKRAWVCVPILLWPLVFVPLLIAVIIFLPSGWATPSDFTPPTDEQQFAQRLIALAVAILALVISLFITRRVVRKLFPAATESPNQTQSYDVSKMKKIRPLITGLTPEERQRMYREDFGKPPFYLDTRKWLDANFEGNIYVGPDLSKYGFSIEGQKIKPWETVKYPYIFVSDLEGHMRSWNYAMARKLGLAESLESLGLVKSKKKSKPIPDDWAI